MIDIVNMDSEFSSMNKALLPDSLAPLGFSRELFPADYHEPCSAKIELAIRHRTTKS